MGKLRTFSGNDICRILEQNGFVQVRQRGSHILMQKRTADSTITVPVPNHKEIRLGTTAVNHSAVAIAERTF